jgi:hypothetical protein
MKPTIILDFGDGERYEIRVTLIQAWILATFFRWKPAGRP